MLYANLIVALIGFFYLSQLLRGERWVESLFLAAPIATPITLADAVSTGVDTEPCDLP
jgi:hypothetical protein